MRASPPVVTAVISRRSSARRVQTHPTAPGCSKRNGDRHTTPSFGSVRRLLSTRVAVLTRVTGPCQPSMVCRYLRNLEGVSPPLSLTHLACQTTAKAFTATRAHTPSPSLDTF